MLDKGIIERVVIDYKDIHKDAVENGMKTPLDIPYFEGDFWPNILEDCIKECEQEEAKRRKEEEEALAAANDDYSAVDDTYDDGSSKDGMASQNGKKKAITNQQKKKNMKSKLSQRKSVKKLGSSSDLMTKILGNMDKHKEVFFVIRLLEAKQVAQMGCVADKDPAITCDLMNGRDEFLNFAKDKHHEFSTLRRAKHSTMALLYELHNQNSEKFVYTCNTCRVNMEARYHCTVCEDFDQCAKCQEARPHEHRMELLTGGEAGGGEGRRGGQAKSGAASGGGEQQKTPKPYIELYLATFMHAVNCRNANCTFAKCMQFKRVVQHSKQCQKFKNSQCEFCRQLIALCIYHAKSCKDDMCQVPLCGSIKIKLKQQKVKRTELESKNEKRLSSIIRPYIHKAMALWSDMLLFNNLFRI
jgi:E1A/CREB-binding protein